MIRAQSRIAEAREGARGGSDAAPGVGGSPEVHRGRGRFLSQTKGGNEMAEATHITRIRTDHGYDEITDFLDGAYCPECRSEHGKHGYQVERDSIDVDTSGACDAESSPPETCQIARCPVCGLCAERLERTETGEVLVENQWREVQERAERSES